MKCSCNYFKYNHFDPIILANYQISEIYLSKNIRQIFTDPPCRQRQQIRHDQEHLFHLLISYSTNLVFELHS